MKINQKSSKPSPVDLMSIPSGECFRAYQEDDNQSVGIQSIYMRAFFDCHPNKSTTYSKGLIPVIRLSNGSLKYLPGDRLVIPVKTVLTAYVDN